MAETTTSCFSPCGAVRGACARVKAFGGVDGRNLSGVNEGPHAAGGAEPWQVGGQAVGEVRHCGGDSHFGKPVPESQTRLGVEMLLDGRATSPVCGSAAEQGSQAEFSLA